MNRLFRIARREYLAYVRTVGFWLSILLLPVGLSAVVGAPILLQRSTPVANVAVADFSGRQLTAVVAKALIAEDRHAIAHLISAPGAPFANADQASARLKPYLAGDLALPAGGNLDALAILRPARESVSIDFWSRNLADLSVKSALSEAITAAVRRDALRAGGTDPGLITRADALRVTVTDFSPRAQAGKVALRDRLPGVAGLAMGLLLWMSILTGAGMLLSSVIEEKGSRILEVLLSSASVPQIMGGKILGVAGVTATVLAFWCLIASTIIALRFPDIGSDLLSVILAKGLWAYFTLYFVGGYLMFATLYVTVGAFCESPREAQILMGPLMILMSLPLVFMTQSVSRPDAPLLVALSFFPPFTPFMMAARSVTDPPLWQVLTTGALMLAFTTLEVWIAIPAFRSGALTTGRFELKTFVAGLRRRSE